MKYTIEGFNQRNAIALGLNSEDLVLLRWFVDFKNTSDMKKIYIKHANDMGYWISYSYLIQELPILFSSNPQYTVENYDSLSVKEKMNLDKKYTKACKQKIKRMLSGNLSKVLLRNKSVNRDDKGRVKSEIYVHINPVVFKLLISDDITAVQKCTTVTEVQKCTTDTVVQKCTIYPSTINTYPSTTHSEQKSKDFSSSEKHENINLIENNTHLKVNSANKEKKVISWDKDRLVKAIEIFKEQQGEYFSLLEKIYNDDKNFVPGNRNNVSNKAPAFKTRFHNINETFREYSPEDLEKGLKAAQQDKFKNTDDKPMIDMNSIREQAIDILQERINSDKSRFFRPTVRHNLNAFEDEINEICNELLNK